MSGIANAPESQYANIIDQIQADLHRFQEDEDTQPDKAFLTLCVNYLGFSLEQGEITDGKDDCGIDFIEHTADGANILQSKSVEFTGKVDATSLAGPSYLTDLPRIRNLINELGNIPVNMRAKLKRSIMEMRASIIGSTIKPEDPYRITVYFCFMGKDFTKAGSGEFAALDVSPMSYGGRVIEITYIPVFLPDLIEEKWKESNNKWANRKNVRVEEFDLPICGNMIKDAKSAVFFTKASALVEVYREIGHQVFEANVRCEIKNSSVNKAIKKSILSHRGRNEFKHLNNGTTVVCENFKSVGSQASPIAFRIRKPGIINGLQTVKTMYDAVAELCPADRIDFIDNCEILVRLHMQNSVSDFRDLVRSTNNQNPMKPRNLRSNDAEQIAYERMFSDLGWFYERKEGAWSAFSGDPKRWSTLPNKRPTDFKHSRLIRKVDNEEIAQSWLSFIGFSEQAVDQKRFLFQQDDIYNLIFKTRTSKHGTSYGSKINSNELMTDAESKSPDPKGLLCSYLIREFALSVVKTRQENRQEAVVRLGIDKKTKNEQEIILSEDQDYLLGSIMRGMLLLFVDFFGFLMFSAFGSSVHEKFPILLRNHSFQKAASIGDFEPIIRLFSSGNYDPADVLLVLWEFYNHCVAQMIGGSWLRQWRDAANRSKFIYGELTRKPLFAEVTSAGQVFRRGILVRIWTTNINMHGGIADYLRETLK